MKKNSVIGVAILVIATVGGFSLYSYYSPDVWLKDIRTASQEGDKERLRDLIDFDSVKNWLKEDIKAQFTTSMGAKLGYDPFAALGVAMASLMVDPMVDMIVSPSGIAALIEKGRVQSPSKDTTIPAPTTSESRSSNDTMNIERGYTSFSRYRIRIWPSDNQTKDPIIMSLKREGLFSWKLSSISLPSNLIGDIDKPHSPKHDTGKPQNPKLISVEASDLQVIDPARPNVIQLTATLRNQAKYDLGYPVLDLVLLNSKDHTLARRMFMPADYLERGKDVTAGLAANAEVTIRLSLDTGTLRPAGFRLDLLPNADEKELLSFNPDKIQIIEVSEGTTP